MEALAISYTGAGQHVTCGAKQMTDLRYKITACSWNSTLCFKGKELSHIGQPPILWQSSVNIGQSKVPDAKHSQIRTENTD